MSDTIFLCLRNSKIANFLGSVSFFEPTPKVLENNSAGKPENNKEKKMIETKIQIEFLQVKRKCLRICSQKGTD